MFRFELNERGYMRKHESSDLEYKENFHRGDDTLKYIKTLVGMANNKGGQIVFGVKNSPHIPLGMRNTKFAELDPKDLDTQIRQFFSQEIAWSMNTVTYDEMLDLYKGEMTVSDRKVLIDKELIDKIKFVKEGHFVDKGEEGAPALKHQKETKKVSPHRRNMKKVG